MKKIALIASAVALALCLAGCGASISGTPSQVLAECQSVPTDQTPTVEVTGYVTSFGVDKLDTGSWAFRLSDETGGLADIGDVACFFESDPDVSAGSRVTVTGSARIITSSSVSLFDCKIKK